MTTATELLRRALDILEETNEWGCNDEALEHEIRDFLAAEPEAEPVAWLRTTPNGDQIVAFHKTDGFEPLYTNPSPSRKPMTEDEWMKIHDEWMASGYALNTRDFVRAIEKHHGIGASDE
jgi:hypothetical protein